MNICYITNFFPPIQTGTSYYVKELSHAMAKRGHRVLAIAPQCRGAPAVENHGHLTVRRVSSWRLPRSRVLMGFDQFYMVSRPGLLESLQQLLSRYKIEIIHQCGHLLDLTYWTPLLARRASLPAVCSIHAVIQYPGNILIDKMVRGVDDYIVGPLGVNRFQGTIALDDVIRNYIRERYPHVPVTLIPYGVNLDSSRCKLVGSFNTEELHIVSVGHITVMRDRCDLIRAVHHLIKEGLRIRLTIIGEKCTFLPEKLVSELGMSKIVVFTGELPREKIIEYLRIADVEAHWITNAGLGTAILEAMGYGLPCLTFAYPHLFDDIPLKDKENIFFVRPGDINGIASCLRSLYYLPVEERARIGQQARNLVLSFFSWDQIAKSFESYYQGIIYKHDIESEEKYGHKSS